MKLPFVRRSTYESDLRAAAAGEARAIKEMTRAKFALASSFGVSVEDVLDSDQVEYRLRLAHVIICRAYDHRNLVRDELHRKLDEMLADTSQTPEPTKPSNHPVSSLVRSQLRPLL